MNFIPGDKIFSAMVVSRNPELAVLSVTASETDTKVGVQPTALAVIGFLSPPPPRSAGLSESNPAVLRHKISVLALETGNILLERPIGSDILGILAMAVLKIKILGLSKVVCLGFAYEIKLKAHGNQGRFWAYQMKKFPPGMVLFALFFTFLGT